MNQSLKSIDTKEVELPETLFVRDIENKVFQSIAVQCLSKIEGIALLEGSFFDHLLGREAAERLTGIDVEQDPKTRSVTLKIEINVVYGVSIPEKAEELQMKLAEEISKYTGLHVASIHTVFKNVVSPSEKISLEHSLDELMKQKESSLANRA